MTNNTEKPSVLLDWFNVSYRTLFTMVFAVLLVGGVGAYYAYIKVFYEGSPKEEALNAINQAEGSLEKAGPVTQEDAATEFKQAAQRLLADARRQYDAANFQDARKSAVESKLNSEKAIAITRGESAREVQFYRVEGDVKVKRVRELIWVEAQEGMSLSVGDQVKTSSRASAQIIYFNGTITTIKPGSLLEIQELYDNPATKVQQVSERLREGKIASATQKPTGVGSYHEIATKNTVAKSEDRTDLVISFDKDQARTTVEVHSGEATLSAGQKDNVKVGTAEVVKVDRDARISQVTSLPPSPLPLEPPDQKVFLIRNNQVPSIELSWRPIPAAKTYRLQISSQPLFAEPMVDLGTIETTAATLPNVAEGGYYWRIAAVFENGDQGPFSNPHKFKVVPAKVAQAGDSEPPELVVDDFLVFASQVIIRGRTEPGALLTVAGHKIDVYDDGSFTTVVPLTHEGVNTVTFIAQDMAGNESRVERTANVDAY
jgi:hypothetical protein